MLHKSLWTRPAGTQGLKQSPEGPRGLASSSRRGGRAARSRTQPQVVQQRRHPGAADRLHGVAVAPPIAAGSVDCLAPGRCGILLPAPLAVRSARFPSGPASAFVRPALSASAPRVPASTSRLLTRDSTGSCSTSSSSSSCGSGQVQGTVLRTIDPVVAAASATRALSRPRRPGASPVVASSATPGSLARPLAAQGTFSSVDTMDETGSGSAGAAGVRLLIVVGVVLLDDPYWTDGGAGEPPQASGSGGGADAGGARPVRVLLAQRPAGKSNAGLWEFPGGKVDPGETPEAALVRELREELDIAVDPLDLQPLTFASHTYPTFHLLMPLYACRRWQREPRGVEGQAVAWATAEEVSSYTLTPADVPLVPAVLAAMRHGVMVQY